MKKIVIPFLMVVMSLAIFPIWAQDTSAASASTSPAASGVTARQLLTTAFAKLGSTHSWSSSAFVATLQQIIAGFPDSTEAVTAKALLVPSLMQQGNYEDALTACNEVMAAQPTSWQSCFAMLNRVSVLFAQGKSLDAMDAAKQAVTSIQATNLPGVKDPDYTAFLKSTGLGPSGIQDGVLGLIAAQKISTGDTPITTDVAGKVHDASNSPATVVGTVGATAGNVMSGATGNASGSGGGAAPAPPTP